MKRFTSLMALTLALGAGCRNEDDTDDTDVVVDTDDTDAAGPDLALAEEVKSSLQRYADAPLSMQADGYFEYYIFYASHPELGGEGIHVQNGVRTRTLADLDPYKPTLLNLDLNEDGTYRVSSAEWLVEDNDDVLTEIPTIFNVEMVGPMTSHYPGQPTHYDLHAHFWNPDDRLTGGYFGLFNPSLLGPSWIADYNNTVLPRLDPSNNGAYTQISPCVPGFGVRAADPAASTTAVDPAKPTAMWTFNPSGNQDLFVALEWTVDKSAFTSAPTMFGKPFFEVGDQYQFLLWMSFHPDGIFGQGANPGVVCPS